MRQVKLFQDKASLKSGEYECIISLLWSQQQVLATAALEVQMIVCACVCLSVTLATTVLKLTRN